MKVEKQLQNRGDTFLTIIFCLLTQGLMIYLSRILKKIARMTFNILSRIQHLQGQLFTLAPAFVLG